MSCFLFLILCNRINSISLTVLNLWSLYLRKLVVRCGDTVDDDVIYLRPTVYLPSHGPHRCSVYVSHPLSHHGVRHLLPKFYHPAASHTRLFHDVRPCWTRVGRNHKLNSSSNTHPFWSITLAIARTHTTWAHNYIV